MDNKTTPKDFFFHLGATLALYIGVIAFVNLTFSIIDYAYPDVLAGYFSASSIAWPISMLVVLVPVLYVLEWLVARDIRAVAEKANIWVARWRIYLTLFLAGATVVTDLIILISTYLNGEISMRFTYKILVVLVIAAAVFVYYIFNRISTASTKIKVWQKVISWFGIIVVVATIIGGFIIVGSPATQRALRLDNQRVQDLSNIQWQIVNHWQMKQALPDSLLALNDSISGYITPLDPATNASYTYKPTALTKFSLCANFDRTSVDSKGRGGSMTAPAYPVGVGGAIDAGKEPAGTGAGITDVWSHGVGTVCFDRTIDPQKYPPFKK